VAPSPTGLLRTLRTVAAWPAVSFELGTRVTWCPFQVASPRMSLNAIAASSSSTRSAVMLVRFERSALALSIAART
jgi:hypothetical protein